ncbi:MAG: hypothetical protein JNM84_02135 [Planctomycetes bacterium]|nr:hypothetical protein [Planctomycetota bacterium]
MRSCLWILAGLAGFVAFQRSSEAQALTRLESSYGSSASTALHASSDGQRIYVADGATVTILDAASTAVPMPTVAQVPVFAQISQLLLDPTEPQLYIAGGSHGLLKMHTAEAASCDPCTIGKQGGCHPVVVLDDDDPATTSAQDNEKFCLGLAVLGGQYLVATFGARDLNEVRIYALATLRAATSPISPLSIASIPPHPNSAFRGPAHALAVRASRAYVALGGQGLARVDFAIPTAPSVIQGPVFGPANNPFPGQTGDVRSVAIARGRLYATVDGLGMAEIWLGAPWSPNVAVNLIPMQDAAGFPHYPIRLSALEQGSEDFLLGVAVNSAPAMAADAAPFNSWGAVSYDVAPGNLPTTPAEGAQTGLIVMSGSQSSGVQVSSQVFIGTQEWQGLQLRAGPQAPWSYELHKGTVQVRDLGGSYAVIASRNIAVLRGKNPARVGFSEANPRLLLTTTDYYPNQGPFLATCTPGCIDAFATPPGGVSDFGVITNFDAQWIEPSIPGASWLLRGRKSGGWWLQLLQTNGICGGVLPSWYEWRVDTSPDSYGLTGRLGYFGHKNDAWDPDLLLATRTATRDGLVAYSRSRLAQVALQNPPPPTSIQGPALSCQTAPGSCEVWRLDTHPEFKGWNHGCSSFPCDAIREHFSARVLNLDCDTAQIFDPSSGSTKWIVATAAGYHSRDPQDPLLGLGSNPDGAFYTSAMLTVHDLSTVPISPSPLLRLYSSTKPGNATDVKIVTVASGTWVLASDYAGHLQCFDITGLGSGTGGVVTSSAIWTLPLNLYDGLHDNASEVEVDTFVESGTTRTLAYVACYRRGVEVLDLTNLPIITKVATLDTPGLAEGVKLRSFAGSKRLLVACRAGGVHIFAP